MASGDPSQPTRKSEKREHAATAAAAVVIAIAACLMLAGCAQTGGGADDDLFGIGGVASIAEAAPQDPQKAVEYWGKAYSKDPRDLDKALSYAQSLKATGQKSQALVVLQQATMLHGSDRRLASDYGRLALELDQVSVAKRLLEAADDPANPDWRVIMARGTVLAKETKYAEAIPFYERALALAHDHPSVMNNLALAYTMSGDAAKAEALLRRAAEANGANAKVRQNLALVLGLQGKYDEAIRVGSAGQSPDTAQANTDLLRKIVKLDPKADGGAGGSQDSHQAGAVAAAWNAEVLAGGDGAAESGTPRPTPVAASRAEMGTWPHISNAAQTGEASLLPLPVQQ
jgi:Flp pilus assembly protein TadD